MTGRVARTLLVVSVLFPSVVHGDIFDSVKRGRVDEVRKYLDSGGDPNARDPDGRTLLQIAVSVPVGSQVGELLVQKGAEVNVRDAEGATPLFLAARGGHLSWLVPVLLKAGADPNAATKDGYTPLDAAVTFSDDLYWDSIQALLQRKATGSTLHAAMVAGDVAQVRRLLDKRADPNALDHHGRAPLHWAALGDRCDVEGARLLIEAGADVNGRAKGGFTPLHLAGSCPEVARLLIRHDAKVGARDDQGETPLHAAANAADLETLRLLLASGADINAQGKWGDTPLCLAFDCGGGPDVVRFLLAHHADPNLGQPLLGAAASSEGPDMVKLLIRYGADPKKAVTQDGWTMLHVAAAEGQLDAMQVALDHGIDVNARDRDGRTAIFRAARNDGIGGKTWRFLVNAGADIWAEDKERLNVVDWAAVLSASDVFPGSIPPHLRETAAARNIHTATIHGSLEKVRAFLDRGVSPNARHPRDGKTPLHWACRMGRTEIARLLIARGADVNAREDNGKTPLRIARTQYGKTSPVRPELVQLLLEHGAIDQ